MSLSCIFIFMELLKRRAIDMEFSPTGDLCFGNGTSTEIAGACFTTGGSRRIPSCNAIPHLKRYLRHKVVVSEAFVVSSS